MDIKIIETNEVKTLYYWCDYYKGNRADDYVAHHGGIDNKYPDGCIQKDEEGNYYCTQRTYEWWAEIFEKEKQIQSLIEEYGKDPILGLNREDGDLELDVHIRLSALQEYKEFHALITPNLEGWAKEDVTTQWALHNPKYDGQQVFEWTHPKLAYRHGANKVEVILDKSGILQSLSVGGDYLNLKYDVWPSAYHGDISDCPSSILDAFLNQTNNL